jgi:uncharacterized protein YjbI with pentapeptide repeats
MNAFNETEIYNKLKAGVALEYNNATINADLNSTGLKLIKSKINIINSKINGDIFFRDVSFQEHIDLSGSVINGTVNFSKSKFNYTCFENTIFERDTTFDEAVFSSYADFSSSIFQSTATFDNARLQIADFHKATFNGPTYFGRSEFEKQASFNNARFKNETIFGLAQFHDVATFWNAEFSGNAWFAQVMFDEESKFDNTSFNHASFSDSNFLGMNNSASFKYCTFHKNVIFGRVWSSLNWHSEGQ